MAPAGRRKYKRYETRMPVDIVATSGWLSAEACDISEAGVRFRSRNTIAPETHVSIRFKGQHESHFTGSVIWTAAIPETEGFRYHIGVKFKVIIFADDRVMAMPSKAEMVQKVLAEIKKVGGAVRKK